jgi:hypothetical protein
MSGDKLADYELKILANVEKYGCHVTTVFDPENQDPSFAYSTGFTETAGQGEIIVFGLDHELMHRMINTILQSCRDGLSLTDGERIEGVLDGFDVIARQIPPTAIDREHFNSAIWFHRLRFGTELCSAFQIVWPGAQDGLFPGDDRCDQLVVGMQPALYKGGERSHG